MLGQAKNLVYSVMPIRRRFERINARNQWGSSESLSGHGSTLANTANIRAELPALFRELGVRKVVDVACGDFNWMPEVVETTGVDYAGYDIVPAQVARNSERHGRPGVRFAPFDITSGVPEESGDLVLFRDCMLHLSFADGLAALSNVGKMDARWVLTSTDTGIERNTDIVTGRFRPIDLLKPPYDLPTPERSIDENEGRKTLALWPIAALRRN